jgi:type II secretory pathway pseudopilin PulG
MSRRRGASLVELLVVVGLIAVLLGLILPAIMSVRGRAERLKSQNNLKQIVLALHNYASATGGQLPGLRNPTQLSDGDQYPLGAILPYLDIPAPPPYFTFGHYGMEWAAVPAYRSPLDPTLPSVLTPQADGFQRNDHASYAANMTAFIGPPRLPGSFQDGTTSTLAVAEHYCRTYSRSNLLTYPGTFHNWKIDLPPTGSRSATFADPNWADVLPVTSGNPPRTVASVRGTTFQVAPLWE